MHITAVRTISIAKIMHVTPLKPCIKNEQIYAYSMYIINDKLYVSPNKKVTHPLQKTTMLTPNLPYPFPPEKRASKQREEKRKKQLRIRPLE